MDTLGQGIHTTQEPSPSGEVLRAASIQVENTLDPKYVNQVLTRFFRGLEEYIVHPRYIDFIVEHRLADDPGFQRSLSEKLTVIFQSPTILSDDGWDLQNFLIILATYGEVFREVKLPAVTAEVLRKRIEFLMANGQSGAVTDRLAQFLPRH